METFNWISCGSDCIDPNVLRAGARSPVLLLRQGYGACTLLWADYCFEMPKLNFIQHLLIHTITQLHYFFCSFD